eukprot:3079982-Pyramimonas_sp.AAC.1
MEALFMRGGTFLWTMSLRKYIRRIRRAARPCGNGWRDGRCSDRVPCAAPASPRRRQRLLRD